MTETNANQNKPLAAPLGQEAQQRTIDVLCESFARDEIDVEDFEQRVELVHRAGTLEELRAILADLPTSTLPVKGDSQSHAATVPYSQPSVGLAPRPTLPPERVPGHSVVVGIMGGFDVQQTVTSTSDPEAPVIRVTGLAIMGGASVTVLYPGETARDGRLRLKAKQKALRQIAKGK